MGNNPVMMVDPDGELAFLAVAAIVAKAAAIGAGIGAAGYTAAVGFSDGGFDNWDWGQFGNAAAIGAVSGVVTAGIGSAFGAVGGGATSLGGQVAHEVGRAVAHGIANVGVQAAFGNHVNGTTFATGAISSLVGSGTHNLGVAAQIGGSALSGGIASELGGGDFWRGAATGATIAGLNHGAHATVEGFKNRALVKGIERDGWNPIDLSDKPYKRFVEGMRLAKLYARGNETVRNAFPDGLRIQDLYDMNSVANSPLWTNKSGQFVAPIYFYENSVAKIRLDSQSFFLGDVDTRTPYQITLYDNPSNWTAHQIAWIHYNKSSYSYWLKAKNFINR